LPEQQWHRNRAPQQVQQSIRVGVNSAGQATATSTVAEDYALARTGWYVNVHFGPDLSDAEYAPSIACGDLPPA
jgi:hypothetical protein